jgi:nitrite reductase/ring-hydroxylating ferredoxin subunit
MERVCKVTEVQEGKMRGYTVKNSYILVANVNGKFYAVDSICPHEGGYLPIGNLEKNIIICPVHSSQYDVTTGKLVKDVSRLLKILTGRGSHDLNSYPVSVMDNDVYIEL